MIVFKKYLSTNHLQECCRNIFNPLIFFNLFLILYLLIGFWNESTHRGQIETSTYYYFLLFVFSVNLGFAFPSFKKRNNYKVNYNVRNILFYSTLVFIIPIWGIVMTKYAEVFKSINRFNNDTIIIYAIEYYLIISTLFYIDKNKYIKLLLLFFGLLLVFFTGFRGKLIVFIFVNIWIFTCSENKMAKNLLLIFTMIFSIFGLFYLRYFQSEFGIPSSNDLINFIYSPLAENIGNANNIFRSIKFENLFMGNIFIADFLTIFSSNQLSGGKILNLYLYGDLKTGITPTVVGAFYADFGFLGIIFVGIIFGAVLMNAFIVLYLNSNIHLNKLIYIWILAYSIHFFHRGVFKPAYFVFPLSLILLNTIYNRIKKFMMRHNF